MSAERDAESAETYLNPVHARDFPDPYVLRFAGEYFAYCTGFWKDGRAFGVMRSRDLVRWEELAGALAPLAGEHPCYWAPEVFYRNGKFLLYYSVGNETLMHVRVAVADRPEGPFTDSGRRLTNEEFAIDPHVFADADGARYLFYATDFLAHTHVGTGTVVDRLTDDFTLAGRPRPVTRARHDWQVYDPARAEKGGVRWHTVEGPFVLKRKGRYYEMFSGGNWQNVSYGVSYAVSDRVLSDEEWEQHADGVKVLPILRTIPGKVVGPGHNSVVRGPDNQQLFCVYHRWAEEGRVLAIDRMEFVGDSLAVLGPTTTPQPAPTRPSFADYFDGPRAEGLGEGWECRSGRWSVRDGEARQEAARGPADARCELTARSFIAEVTLRSLADETGVTSGGAAEATGDASGGVFGACVWEGESAMARLKIDAGARRVVVEERAGGGWSETFAREFVDDFDARAHHLLRAEADGSFLRFALDGGVAFDWRGSAERDVESGLSLSLFTEDHAAAFKGLTLARGFADEFDDPSGSVARGWDFGGASRAGEPAEEKFEGALLRLAAGEGLSRVVTDGADSFELVLNLRIDEEGPAEGQERAGYEEGAGHGEGAGDAQRAGDAQGAGDGEAAAAGRGYAISPGVVRASGAPLRFELAREGGGWSLRCETDAEGGRSFALPSGFAPAEFQQFRFRRAGGRVVVRVGGASVCEVAAGAGWAISIAAGRSPVAVDLVRLTAIKSS